MKALLQLTLIFFTQCAVNASDADSNSLQWGKETNGIQLGISLTKSVYARKGVPVLIKIRIRNNSTNTAHYPLVGIAPFDPSYTFSIISPSGKDVSPKPLQSSGGSGTIGQVNPGQTTELEMDLKQLNVFNEVGEYKLTLKRKILVVKLDDFFDVASNTLVVPVAKPRKLRM